MTEPTDALLPCPFCGEAAKHSFNSLYGDMSMASCKSCGATAYAPKWNRRAALAKWGQPAQAAEPVAYLHDDGYWTAAKNDAGRRLNDRLLFAGSPKVAVYTAPQPTQPQAGVGEPVAVIEFTDGVKEPRIMSWNALPAGQHRVYTAPQPTHAQAGAVPLDEARRLFDAGWKAAALFCDREDVVADGIIGFGACPQFEAAFSAANGIKGGQHVVE